MKFCSNGTEFTKIWYDDGINPCFQNTVTSGLLFCLILTCGCIQCRVFSRYSTPVKKIKANCGTVFQIFLTLMLMIEAASHIITQDMTKGNSELTGSELFTSVCLFFAWGGSLRLLSLERKHMLHSKPSKCHGLVLQAFWTLAFLRENVPFISWRSHSWWWYLSR